MAIEHLQTTVVDLFDYWAKTTPDAAAVQWNGQILSYAYVRHASLHVSKALLSSGVGPGDKIPITSQMSLELVPSILGVLRTGASYVPVDLAGWSKARVDATIKDLSPPVVLATSKLNPHGVPASVNFKEQWLCSSFDDTETCSQLDAIRRNLDTKALVYVTFTSGTTGKPKGVMIFHQGLHRFVTQTHGDSLILTPGERMMTAFSISFDGKPCPASPSTLIFAVN
jgi:non-ribosomal peptide synthetase component F